jgi:hypothetical protein
MSFDVERLYQLLPAIYRIRDEQLAQPPESGPLKALLAVIADQVGILEENLSQLYDDQFVETCAPWVLPYLGDLIGLKGLPGVGPVTLSPRAEVAHTIGYRRRKGTAAMLQQLARDVTDWPARAVEFFQLLATTQYVNHVRPASFSFIDVRNASRLESLGGPFERAETVVPPQLSCPLKAGGGGNVRPARIDGDLTHTVDVRRIARGRGFYNIPNVGLFLWRLRAYSLTRSPAVALDPRRFLFSPLGQPLPLFNLPQTEDEVFSLAQPINVPARLGRRMLADNDNLADYYGSNLSFVLEWFNPGQPGQFTVIPQDQIHVCDLSDLTDALGHVIGWAHPPKQGVSVDPVLGRIFFSADQTRRLLVTFHYGFSADMGGGEYNRVNSFDTQLQPILRVSNTHREEFSKIQDALDALPHRSQAGGVVEIMDSSRYEEDLTFPGNVHRIELRAADKQRPALVLPNATQPITGGPDDQVTLNGLLITGARLEASGLGRLRILHCTLVPGIKLNPDGTPAQAGTPSLSVTSANRTVEIDHSIVGGLRALKDATVLLTDSIVDATADTGIAFAAPDESAGGSLRVQNSTVIGKIHATLLPLASDSIFLASLASGDDPKKWPVAVQVEQRQEGCVRFCFVPPGSRVPRRYHCQPAGDTDADAARVRPVFSSLRYGDPEYAQLSDRCAVEICRGADDEAEMGAFHNLYQPQREDHLRTRLDEYLRFGLEVGIFHVT